MAALANILALLSISIPLSPFTTRLHFIQLPILLAGVLGGVWVGAVAGGLGAVIMSSQVGIPFIIGSNAILGGVAGYLTRRRVRPFLASSVGILAQLPYVAVTDLLYLQWPIVQVILVKLALEGLVSAGIVSLIVRSTAVRTLTSGLRI